MRIAKILALAVVCAAPASLDAQQPLDRIPVFVTTAAAADGFTDPSKDRQDSIKDLLKKLEDSDSVRPADSKEDAVAVLEVLDRDTKRETNLFGRQNKSFLAVRLTAGDYSVEFTGESGSKGMFKGYGAAAGKVVDQLEDWVTANRERLSLLKK